MFKNYRNWAIGSQVKIIIGENMFYKNTNYEIFEDGKCFSHYTNKFLTPSKNEKYPRYKIKINGKSKPIAVHRMVAETFIPNPNNKPYVNHKDGNKQNFHKNNLEWVTAQENNRHAINTGLRPKCGKKDNYYIEDLENESWVECFEYNNYYISSYGRVMNKNTKYLLSTKPDGNGYPAVHLFRDGKGIVKQVHRLEYKSFFPDDNIEGYVINHKDGNKTNNLLDNLEKVTLSENALHAEYIIKTHKGSKPVEQYLIKDKKVTIIKEYPSAAQAIRETGLSSIRYACTHGAEIGGFFWRYK